MAGTITHSWNGTILSITSDSGTTAMDLKGEKGDTGARGARGLPGKAGGGARIEDGVISDETTWSSSGIIDRFAELMGTNANPAVLDNPYPNYPLQITTTFEAKQSGSGEPSPSNIRLISSFNSAKLTRCGKNMLKNTASTYTTNGISFTVNDDGTVTANGMSLARAQLRVGTVDLPAGSYIASIGFVSDVNVTGTAFASYMEGGVTKYADMSGASERSFTLAEPTTVTYMIDIRTANITVSNQVFYPMIRLASITDANYEPYQGDTYTIDFGQTISNGMLDWNTGVLTVEWGYKAFDGTEEWTKAESDKNYFYTPMNTLEKTNDYITSIKCSTFRTADTYMYLPGNVGISGYYDSKNDYPGENWIYINNGVSTSTSELKEWLAAQSTAGTPVQVCYKLATPTTIQLTPQEIKAIKGINSLYSNAQELTVIGRVDTMYQLSKLAERVAALESR